MMKNIPIELRGAKFISALALLFPNGDTETFEGIMPGSISTRLIGEAGKGYQRIFVLDNGKTIAESGSGMVCKNDHRDQAITKAVFKINIWLRQFEK
jgi:XTP/dITP diphosphohydrolase